jgi:hypothetical protein
MSVDEESAHHTKNHKPATSQQDMYTMPSKKRFGSGDLHALLSRTNKQTKKKKKNSGRRKSKAQ